MNANDVNRSKSYQKRVFKLIFNLISAVLIPVLLAMFTIIFTLQQESIAKINREVDLRIADEQHQQNLALALDEQRNAQLIAYMREVSDLLLANNFSLNELILTSIVQPKTLAALRQLDVTRKSYLLRFLHESRLLSTLNSSFLSLASADFNHIHLGVLGESIDMRYTSFYGTHLNNISFVSISLGFSVFRYARLHEASFHAVSFEYASFHSARLQNASFEACAFYKADLTRANMSGAKISDKLIESAGSVSDAILPNDTIGRNQNLFNGSFCQKIDDKYNIEQNVSVNQYRLWMREIGRVRKLDYLITGWFNNSNNLYATSTEFNQNGVVLQKYCFVTTKNLTDTAATQLCTVHEWSFIKTSFLNDGNQYKYISNRIGGHNEVYMIQIDINLGQYGSCQDVHFSIETT